MHRFLLCCLVCSLTVCYSTVYTFDVGTGLFTVCRSEQNALVIDCGCGMEKLAHCSRSTAFSRFVREVFRGVESTWVIVTHNHFDHYCLIDHIFFNNTGKNDVLVNCGVLRGILVCADTIPGWAQKYHYNNNCIVVCALNIVAYHDAICNFLSGWNNQYTFANVYLANDNFLASNDFRQGHVHDKNFLIKVKFRVNNSVHAVLFTGDASWELMDYLIKKYQDLFDDVNFALVPHHGSCRDKQHLILEHYANNGIVSIVSSYPCAAGYWLPRDTFYNYANTLNWCCPVYNIVHSHDFLYADNKIVRSCKISMPLFLTSSHNVVFSGFSYNHMDNAYIQCNFYELSNALRYMPNNIVEYFGFAKSLGNYRVNNSVDDLRTALSNYANNQYLLLIDKCNATNCGIQITDVLDLLKAYSLVTVLCCQQRDLPLQQNMLDIIEKRCILTPLDESDTVENDAEICNECCMLL